MCKSRHPDGTRKSVYVIPCYATYLVYTPHSSQSLFSSPILLNHPFPFSSLSYQESLSSVSLLGRYNDVTSLAPNSPYISPLLPRPLFRISKTSLPPPTPSSPHSVPKNPSFFCQSLETIQRCHFLLRYRKLHKANLSQFVSNK